MVLEIFVKCYVGLRFLFNAENGPQEKKG